jgi:hypothetical protein
MLFAVSVSDFRSTSATPRAQPAMSEGHRRRMNAIAGTYDLWVGAVQGPHRTNGLGTRHNSAAR